jgi:hypothetical protein
MKERWRQTPSPSIERTSSSMLRVLTAAAHVKHWAPKWRSLAASVAIKCPSRSSHVPVAARPLQGVPFGPPLMSNVRPHKARSDYS